MATNRRWRPPTSRFDGRSGFTFNYAPGSRPDLGFLVLARYDPEISRSVAELVDLNSQQTVHRWLPDYELIREHANFKSNLDTMHANDLPDRVRMHHPLVLEDGSLVYNNYSPLIRIDACSKLMWTEDHLYHHSIEPASDGGFWGSVRLEPQTIKGVGKEFFEDAIFRVSRDGVVQFQKSVPQLLIENNLDFFVYALDNYASDPTHLNDIQEVLADGKFWKKGDVFISARNISTIFLYRPSENKVIWYKQWDWVNQHDVDILDDHRISVFDNQKFNYNYGPAVNGFNNVLIYDFETMTLSAPWAAAMEKHEVRTISEGRSEILNAEEIFLEETNYGRLMTLRTDGTIVWEYVNRGSDGKVYKANWSRIMSREHGDKVVKALQEANCSQ